MKFTKIGFTLFVVLTVLLTACGGEQVGPDTGGKPTATSPARATATNVPGGPTTKPATTAPAGATTAPAGPTAPSTPVVVVPTSAKNKIVLGTTSSLTHLNPLLSTSWIVSALAGLTTEGLIEVDGKGAFVPVLADGFPTLSADKLSLTYKLKRGVKFATGADFTCADVKFTAQAAQAKGSRYRAAYEDIASVDCPDDYTAVVKFSQPYADFLQLFSYVLPKAAGDPNNLENWGYNRNPYGTGPFAVAEWKDKDSITYGANKNYREKGKPALDAVVVKFISTATGALKDLTADQTDIVLNLSDEDIPAVKALESKNISFATTPDGQAMTLVFNLGDPKVDAADPVKNPHPALSDLKVRQAIQLGIDKAQIIKDLLGSYTKPTASVLNVGPFACQVKLTPANVNDAKALLDSAGWRAGSDGIRAKGNQKLALTLKTYSSESAALNLPVAKALVPMMKNIGIDLKVEEVGYRDFVASWDNKGLRKHGDFDLLLFVDGTRDIDPDKFLVSAFKTSEIPSTANKGDGSNFARYSSKDMDALLDKVATTPDGRARQTTYCQIATLVANDLPRTMLYETLSVTAYNTQLQNFQVSPGPKDFAYGAANWYVKK